MKFKIKRNSFAKFHQPARFQTNRTKDSQDIALSFFHCLSGLRLWRHICVRMRLKTFKMATSILLKFQTLEWDISRTIWRIEVSEGSFFCIFLALSFELNLFFEWSCPLNFRALTFSLNMKTLLIILSQWHVRMRSDTLYCPRFFHAGNMQNFWKHWRKVNFLFKQKLFTQINLHQVLQD